MNQRNSTIELSSSFQPEMMQGRVAGKSFKKIRYIQYCFLIRAVLMVKKYMHENLKHTVMKHLAKNSNNNKKKSKQIFGQENFSQLLPAIADMFHISYQTILTLSWSTPKQYFTLFSISNNAFSETYC